MLPRTISKSSGGGPGGGSVKISESLAPPPAVAVTVWVTNTLVHAVRSVVACPDALVRALLTEMFPPAQLAGSDTIAKGTCAFATA
jgi:hypothetical protein